MDIRILTLLVLITIAGSSADLRSPFRLRRSPNSNTWTGTSDGAGVGAASAGAFASSSAGAFAGAGSDKGSVADRGAFVDTSNVPNRDYAPNTGFGWGYGGGFGNAGGFSSPGGFNNPGGFSNAGGDTLFEPNSFAFPGYNLDSLQKQFEENFRQLQNQFQQQQQALFDTANRIGTDGYSGSGAPGGSSAVSSINLGPGGGYQAGAISPAAPGIASRFGEDIPPPSGNSYGVFAGSSSRTVVGPDGKPISHKVSTTGVNDNGKITFRTIQD
ncbi:uncharacterized protein LOC143186954 [Calliopsis andreniformis]|uniref:uncharacterized protein LOC143186954 n=1 Tax=Calliopsis andreniformis TaxID=337506 RepID=UPI003FCC834C